VPGERPKGFKLLKAALQTRKAATMLAFGFSSGLPFSLLVGTLTAWLGEVGVKLATIGIFLPAFLFVAASGPLLPRVRRSAGARAALDGVNVASLALMAAVTIQLARSALAEPAGLALATASAVALIRFRVSAAWLVLAGALLGLVASFVR